MIKILHTYDCLWLLEIQRPLKKNTWKRWESMVFREKNKGRNINNKRSANSAPWRLRPWPASPEPGPTSWWPLMATLHLAIWNSLVLSNLNPDYAQIIPRLYPCCWISIPLRLKLQTSKLQCTLAQTFIWKILQVVISMGWFQSPEKLEGFRMTSASFPMVPS